jgi:hypothetical protein
MKRNATSRTQQIAHLLSDRTGQDIPSRDVRITGHWVFHRHPEYPTDIDCYRLPLPMCAEPWSGIALEVSPFKRNNAVAVAAAIQTLDASYTAHGMDDGPDEEGR